MNMMRTRLTLAVVALASMAALSCNSELTDSAAPVELVVTNTQNLSRLDLDPLANDADCNENIGTINMQVIPKGGASGTFLQVRVQRYRVSYRRTDGGTVVPSSFVRSIDTLMVCRWLMFSIAWPAASGTNTPSSMSGSLVRK